MTHESELREELEALAPELELAVPPTTLIKRGRRRRAVRQTLVSSGAVAAVVAVAAAGVVLSEHRSAANHTATAGAPAGVAPAPNAACGVDPQPTDGAPAAANDGSTATPWGDRMAGPSGIAGTQMTVTAFHVDGMPCTNVGFAFALSDADGRVTNLLATNETDGSDVAPGFHDTSLATTPDGWFVVGYFVGPAASVTVAIDGQPVTANLTSWSVNPDVKVWWTHGGGAAPSEAQPTALDVTGNPLPAGSHGDQLGVG